MADTTTTPKFNLKYGKLSELASMAPSVGTISVTTDTHSMYVDLPVKDDKTGTTEINRFRIGDFEKYKTLTDLALDSKNWYVGSLALIENVDEVEGEGKPSQAPILAYYNGDSWININDTADLKKGIEDLREYADQLYESGVALYTSVGNKPTDMPSGLEDYNLWQIVNMISLLLLPYGDDSPGLLQEVKDLQASVGEKPADEDDLWTTVTQLSKDIEDILGTGTDGDPTSIAGLNKKIEDEKDRAEAAEAALGERIDGIINNYSTTTAMNKAIGDAITTSESKISGQISNTLNSANSYTDTEVKKEKDRAEAQEATLNQRIESVITNLSTNYSNTTAMNKAIGDAITTSESKISGQISNTLNSANSYTNEEVGKEKQRAEGQELALNQRIDGIDTKFSNYSTTTAMNSAITNAITASESTINGKISDTLKEANDYTDDEIKKEKQRAEGQELALSQRITTLVGTVAGDDAKSVRTISAEEVAKIVANAPDRLDTLEEIAAWIGSDTTGAVQMANDITALKTKTTLGKNSSNTEYSTVEDFVNAVKAELVAEITKVNNQFYWQPFTATTTE